MAKKYSQKRETSCSNVGCAAGGIVKVTVRRWTKLAQDRGGWDKLREAAVGKVGL